MSQVALVTGAARRVGAAIAKHLHTQGLNIIIHYRDSLDAAKTLSEQLNALRPDSAVILHADLCNIPTLETLINTAHSIWGRLDLLVNNASTFYPTPLGEVTEASWDDLHSSNVKGAFFLSQVAFPFLQTQQGVIINIADIHAHRPLRHYSVYCIAKAALVMMTKALAKEFAPSVRVNTIAPGNVAWPEAVNCLDDEKKQSILAQIPLQRQGQPEDIAQAVYSLFLAKFVTGQFLAIDGGRSID